MDLFIHHQSHILSLSPISSPPPTFSSSLGVDLVGNRISPSILLIIVIVAVIFFLSGILHLLVRYLLRPNAYRDADDPDNTDAATSHQGQLQQLFHLHDCGVDQSFIDTLPVFPYKAIIGGVKDPFDCAVCLCEFEADDKLRLLPKCSHAFHVECIDTWLLSHSTCPLCRSTLQSSTDTRCRSQILVLIESESSREVASSGDTDPQEETQRAAEEETETEMETETKVVQVKLGKFRGVEGSSNVDNVDRRLDQRRCFSMGTYEYVMNDNSLLRIAIKPSKKRPLSAVKRQRLAMSECDCHSRRGFGEECIGNARISGSSSSTGKRESFSVSKIWLRTKKEKQGKSCEGGSCSSRRAFSFRLPALLDESKAKSAVSPRTTVSEFGGGMWEKDGSEMDIDVEVGSCNNSIVSMGSQIEQTPSFARRTLLWIVGNGRQNRVGSMS